MDIILDLITNPIFIIFLILGILALAVVIIYSNLNNRRKKVLSILDENKELLVTQNNTYKTLLDSYINTYLTDQNIINELTRLRKETDINDNDLLKLINSHNEIYKFINNPLIKTEEYKSIDEGLTNAFKDKQIDTIINERKTYNNEATKYNTSLSSFPSSLLAPLFGHTSLVLFEDFIEKTATNIVNSASYLNNNFNVNRETIKSPEKAEEQTSNLFLAKQNKPSETPQVVINTPQNNQLTSEEVIKTPTEQTNNQIDITPSQEPIQPVFENSQISSIEPEITSNFQNANIIKEEPSFVQPSPIEITPQVEPQPEPEVVSVPEPVPFTQEQVQEISNLDQIELEKTQIITPQVFQEVTQSPTEEPNTFNNEEVVTPLTETPQRFCPNCNKLTTEKFCPECGYPTE